MENMITLHTTISALNARYSSAFDEIQTCWATYAHKADQLHSALYQSEHAVNAHTKMCEHMQRCGIDTEHTGHTWRAIVAQRRLLRKRLHALQRAREASHIAYTYNATSSLQLIARQIQFTTHVYTHGNFWRVANIVNVARDMDIIRAAYARMQYVRDYNAARGADVAIINVYLSTAVILNDPIDGARSTAKYYDVLMKGN